MLRPKADLLPQTHDKDTIPTNSSIKTHYTHHTHKPIEISKNQNLPYPQKKEKKKKKKKKLKLEIFSSILKILSILSSLPFSSFKCDSLHQLPPICFKKKVKLLCSTNSIVSFFLNSTLMLQWQQRDTLCFQINVLNFVPCLFFLTSMIKH